MKQKIYFECQKCGGQSLRWQGQCPSCGEWNTLEQVSSVMSNVKSQMPNVNTDAISLKRLDQVEQGKLLRTQLGIEEWDNALGGGIVPGQVILLAGEPGVGKSTLLLTVAEKFAILRVQTGHAPSLRKGESVVQNPKAKNQDIKKPAGIDSPIETLASLDNNLPFGKLNETLHEASLQNQAQSGESASILYYAGEENIYQISQRAKRLGVRLSNTSFIDAETNVDELVAITEREKPHLLLVDSIQTILDPSINSPAGSLAQVRATAQKITNLAKRLSIPTILVGHINKEGNVAGPKVLEHTVDTTLFLEGEKYQSLRFLRVLKNRFGPIDEVGLFEMQNQGLVPANNPSHLFINPDQNVPGSVLAVVMEGTRGLVVEVQALTLPCHYGYPKRSASGVNLNRLQTLLAVMEKRLGAKLSETDVYVSLVGGLKVNEPALDLPICLSVLSALKNKSISQKVASFGEVGLGGEIRRVLKQEAREKQAAKMDLQVLSQKDAASLKNLALKLGL